MKEEQQNGKYMCEYNGLLLHSLKYVLRLKATIISNGYFNALDK